jgi:hypothetical protein
MLYSAHGLLDSRMRQLHPSIKSKPLVGTNSQVYLKQLMNQLGSSSELN